MVVEENMKKKKGMAQLEQKQDDTPLKKEKKKKKEKTPVRAEEVSADGDGEVPVKKKGNKKRTADPVMTSEGHDTEMRGDDGGSSKKKKKKRLENNNRIETEEHLKVSQSTVKEDKENGQSEKKKKKTSSQSVLEKEHVNVESEVKEEVSVVEEKAVGQKSMKKKKGKAEGNVADGQNEVSNGNGEEGLKRKTKKRPAVAIGESEKTIVGVKGETEEGVMKKKKEKAGVEITTESNMEVEKTQKMKKSSEKRKGGKTPNDTEPEVEEGERKKEKKKKAASAKEEGEEAVEVSPKKKKGKKKSKLDGAEEEPVTPQAEGSAKRKKGRKSCGVETEGERNMKPADQTSLSTPGKRTAQDIKKHKDTPVTKTKKKIKEEPQTCDDQGTVVFLSEKTGNADEVNIDQDRRLALQREIDQESQPKMPAAQAGLGQWSTAQFDNANQQQKFLRLMGGFKKGAQPMAAGAGRANMALGKEEQQKLQQGLQGEFERAQARRMDFSAKGLGLGFSAPSNKKFSIDVNACKSVRFDD